MQELQGRNRVVVRYGISVPFFGAPKAPIQIVFFYENWKDTEKNLETFITKNTLNKKKLELKHLLQNLKLKLPKNVKCCPPKASCRLQKVECRRLKA